MRVEAGQSEENPFCNADTLHSTGWKWAVHRQGKGFIPSALGLCSKMQDAPNPKGSQSHDLFFAFRRLQPRWWYEAATMWWQKQFAIVRSLIFPTCLPISLVAQLVCHMPGCLRRSGFIPALSKVDSGKSHIYPCIYQ